MSFRYTNNLVGAMKHRLVLEAAHRDLVRRTFTGRCNGIEVVCSGYGTVLQVRMPDKATWEPHYRKPIPVHREGEDSSPTSAGHTAHRGDLDLAKVAHAIQAATWAAMRKVRVAKEEAHHRSLHHNDQLQSQAQLRHWYEEDATTLRPHPFDALKNEQATPWMQAVRFGKAHPADGTLGRTTSGRVSVLEPADCDPSAIPIGSAHPLFTAGLVQLEVPSGATSPDSTGGHTSRVCEATVLCEQRRELSHAEQHFWQCVELIRRGQLATIPGGVKRSYANQSGVESESVVDKVQLQFSS